MGIFVGGGIAGPAVSLAGLVLVLVLVCAGLRWFLPVSPHCGLCHGGGRLGVVFFFFLELQ